MGANFAYEPMEIDAEDEATFTICNNGDEIPMDPRGGVRINICPSVLNLLQVSQFTGSGLDYFLMGSFFNCSIAEQITTIPADTCFDFIVCIRTNIVPSGLLAGNACNIPANDAHYMCTYSVNINVNTTEEDLSENRIELFPNPAVDFLLIRTGKNINSVQVHSISGQHIIEKKLSDDLELNTKNFEPGMYIFTFLSEDGTTISTEKILVLR